eukprot:Pgem_evm1s12363
MNVSLAMLPGVSKKHRSGSTAKYIADYLSKNQLKIIAFSENNDKTMIHIFMYAALSENSQQLVTSTTTTNTTTTTPTPTLTPTPTTATTTTTTTTTSTTTTTATAATAAATAATTTNTIATAGTGAG